MQNSFKKAKLVERFYRKWQINPPGNSYEFLNVNDKKPGIDLVVSDFAYHITIYEKLGWVVREELRVPASGCNNAPLFSPSFVKMGL